MNLRIVKISIASYLAVSATMQVKASVGENKKSSIDQQINCDPSPDTDPREDSGSVNTEALDVEKQNIALVCANEDPSQAATCANKMIPLAELMTIRCQ